MVVVSVVVVIDAVVRVDRLRCAALGRCLAMLMAQTALLVAASAAMPYRTSAVRVFPVPPSPRSHPLYRRRHTKPPEPFMFSPVLGRRLPGFAAIRGINMRNDLPAAPVQDWMRRTPGSMTSSGPGGLRCFSSFLMTRIKFGGDFSFQI